MLVTLHPHQYDFILACKGDVVVTRYGRGIVKDYRIRTKQYVILFPWGEGILQTDYVYMRELEINNTTCEIM